VDTKVCTKCGQEKPIGDFGKAPGYRGGRYAECKPCRVARCKQWRHKNLAHSRALNRKSWLKNTYGITPEQYDILLESQSGVCAICGKPETRVLKGKVCELAVDHDHVTGRVRGLLCVKCNLGIGSFNDSRKLFARAAAYLKRHEA